MREDRRADLILFAAAAALRAGWIVELSRLPFFDLPTGDALFYARQASRIADGSPLGEGLSYPSSPLYPYLAAAFFRVPGRAAFWLLYLAQAALDAANAVLLRRAGSLLFGRAAGWAAGGFWAAYGLAVFFSADLVEAAPAAFLADAALLLALRAGGPARAAAAGACLAGAALLRPHFLPLLPLAGLGIAALAPRAMRRRAAAAFALAASLPLAASLARNVAVSGEVVLVSPYSGLNAYLGNHAGARGRLSFPAGRGLRNDVDLKEAAHAYPEAVEGRPLGEVEVSRFWWRETLREILGDPARWAALMARKAFLFWSSYEAPNHLDFYFFRGGSVALSLAAAPFGLLAPLAIVGLALVALRARSPEGPAPGAAGGAAPGAPALLAALLLAYWGVSAVFFIGDRFRLPATGWAALLAAGAFSEVLRRASARKAAALWPAALAVALGATLLEPVPERHGAREHVMVAAALAGRGRTAEAERLLRRAVEIDPGSAVARFNLGRHLAGAGRGPEAAREFEETLRLAPDFSAAETALGDLARGGGAPGGLEEMRRRYEASLAIEPYGREAGRLRAALSDMNATAPITSPGGRR